MRPNLARMLSLSPDQRRVALASVVLLPAVQTSLHLRGFNRTARTLATRSERSAVPTEPNKARPAAEAVALVAGRSLVGARCLCRSLVLWFLLRRRGIDAQLVIGAQASVNGELPAHAWVEVSGEPVNDAPDIRERFGSFELQLPPLGEATGR